MKILIIGSGGREHALAWKIRRSPLAEKIYCAPGNAGISEIAECIDIDVNDITGLIAFVKKEGIDFTVVGTEEPLVRGIVDEFLKEGLQIFGPNKEAAQLEGSKAFSKALMKKYNIPTAAYEVFDNYETAATYVAEGNFPVVIKADGLAQGKGVLICADKAEANRALESLFINNKLGESGKKVVIEEFLTGPEVSILAFCDGKTIVPMVSAQDHKRVFDNDQGLNTGGMGAFSPSRYYTYDISRECEEKIFRPTVQALINENIQYKGVIFFGLMLTASGVKVIEYNSRFGDPETQVVLPRLQNDLLELLIACTKGTLEQVDIQWSQGGSACVILASGGYPEAYQKGYPISGLDRLKDKEDVIAFHAGTLAKDGVTLTNGGRVLGVTAVAPTLDEAIKQAYQGVNVINFDKMHFRKDIGEK